MIYKNFEIYNVTIACVYTMLNQMRSRVYGNTPIILSRDKSYVDIQTIESLFESDDATQHVWTPNGWEQILAICQYTDELDNLCHISHPKHILTCAKSSCVLADDFKAISHYGDKLGIQDDVHQIIHDYLIPTVDLTLDGSTNFYTCEFPTSNIIDVPQPASLEDNDVDFETYRECDVCHNGIFASYHACTTCDGYDLCQKCFTNHNHDPSHQFDYIAR